MAVIHGNFVTFYGKHVFIMYKTQRWTRIQVETFVQQIKDARDSFAEHYRDLLDEM